MERPSFLGSDDPASIRYNNPGAMKSGPSSRRFGAIGEKRLNDGLGQNNTSAIFDDAIDGAAAMFDLLDRVYAGMRLRDLVAKWGGRNSIDSYIGVVTTHVPNMRADTIITREMIRHPELGIKFVMAMARHEAGMAYPLTVEQWRSAQIQAFEIGHAIDQPTTAEAKNKLKGSKKYRASGWTKWLLGVGGGGVGAAEITQSWSSLKSTVGVGNEMISTLQMIVSTYGLVMVAGAAIIGAIVFNWLQICQVDDVQEGRYTPSGEEQ